MTTHRIVSHDEWMKESKTLLAREKKFTRLRTKKVDDLDDRPDMLIGMDILKKLHLYIAFGENKLYISEASVPSKPYESAPASAASAAAKP